MKENQPVSTATDVSTNKTNRLGTENFLSLAEERQEHHHDEAERLAQERVVAIKTETDKLTALLESNTDLTRQDKDLTEQVADLTKQIHALLTAR